MTNFVINAKLAKSLAIGSAPSIDLEGIELVKVLLAIVEASNNRKFHLVWKLGRESSVRPICEVLKELGYVTDIVYNAQSTDDVVRVGNISLLIYWF